MARHSPACPPADRGAAGVEYALLVALIAAVIVGALVALGPALADIFSIDFTP